MKTNNGQLMPGYPENISPYAILGLSFKGEGEPTVESLTEELNTTKTALEEAQGKVASLEKSAGDWKSGIDPNHATNPNLQKFDTPADLHKSYLELQKTLGSDKIALPKNPKDAAGWNALYDAIGRPKTAGDYAIPDIKRPDGMPVDEKQLEGFKTKAHELGLNSAQVAGLYEFVTNENIATFNNLTKATAETAQKVENELQNEYGAAWPEKKEAAQKVIDTFAPNDVQMSDKILNDPAALKLFVKLGEKLSEDGILEGDGGSGRLSPKEAQAKINEILGDDKHPFHKNEAAGHKEAVDYMTELYQMADAGKK